jgi:RNA polymerase sigma-70 factor (ECF subfamily)
MASPDPQFEELIGRVRDGCPEAARELFERYGHYVRAVIRRRLHRRLRSVYDSLDFTQSVWASFLQLPPERYAFATPDDLVGFLARVAVNKVTDVFRQRVQTVKCRVTREVPLPEPGEEDERSDGGLVNTRDPSPSQAAIAGEQWERLMAGQSPEVRQVLELLRDGHTQREVARRLRVPYKMIQRVRQKLSQRGGLL